MTEFFLDAYAARSCAVKTHHRFDRSIAARQSTDESLPERFPAGSLPERLPRESLPERFAGGGDHGRQVLDTLAATGRSVVDLRECADPDTRLAQTAEAVRSGAAVIIKPELPPDRVGHRMGRPAALVRGADRPTGAPGYQPLLIKFSRLTERRRQSRSSEADEGSVIRIADPSDLRFAASRAYAELSYRTHNEGALIQAGHYWRLLQAAGWAAGCGARAALIGTDNVGVLWIDLEQRFVRTYSATSESGWRLRSPLQRYDHEQQFRVKVAATALRRTGSPEDPDPLVRPIRIRECDHCPWWERCREQLGSDDLSVRIDKSPLDVREISALRALGVETVHDLIDTDLEHLKVDYLPRVRHRSGAERRLELTRRRAGLLVRGVELERLTAGEIPVPDADVEIDLDIETSRSERVYLWGFRVHDVGSDTPPEYVQFSAWWELGARDEQALAIQAVRWLRALVDSGRRVCVYHYSDYELVQLNRLASGGDPDLGWAKGFAATGFCDLYRIVADHYFGAHGLGLKTVAANGAGFSWRDDDPGGLNSQTWFDEAVHGATPQLRAQARARVLAYNEDDVAATWWVRRWLRAGA